MKNTKIMKFMKIMKTRILGFLMIAAILAAALGGCGSGGNDATTAARTAAAETTAEATAAATTAAEAATTEKATEATTKEAGTTAKETAAEKTTEAEKEKEAATTAAQTTAVATTTAEAPTEAQTAKAGDGEGKTSGAGAPPADFKPVEASKENPAKFGEWFETKRYSTASKAYHTVYVQVTDVLNGEAAQEQVDAFNEASSGRQYGAIDDPDLEYCVITYNVYFPEDFPAQDYGIGSADIGFTAKNPDGGGIRYKGRSYIGLGSTYNISDRIDTNTLFPGDVWAGKALFEMVKDFSDYEISTYYSENNTNVYSYITPPETESSGQDGSPESTEPATSRTAAKASDELLELFKEPKIVKITPADIKPVEGTKENPAALGDWIQICRYNTFSKDDQPVFIRLDGIVRGDEAQAIVDAYNENTRRPIKDLEDPDLEYCILNYTVYFPEEFPAESYGITSTSIRFSAGNPNGGGIPSNGRSYIGIGLCDDISPNISINTLFPGDGWAGIAVFTMVKDYDGFVFETYYNTNGGEGLSYTYIKGK